MARPGAVKLHMTGSRNLKDVHSHPRFISPAALAGRRARGQGRHGTHAQVPTPGSDIFPLPLT